jgi:hypothetical protein
MVVWTIRRVRLPHGPASTPTIRFVDHIGATAILL